MKFIKEHAPKFGEWFDMSNLFRLISQKVLENMTSETLIELEKELTKAFGSEYPKFMLVSDGDEKNWCKELVVHKNKYGEFITELGLDWKYAKELPKLTKQDIQDFADSKGVSIEDLKELIG